jgi:hypothetical protein
MAIMNGAGGAELRSRLRRTAIALAAGLAGSGLGATASAQAWAPPTSEQSVKIMEAVRAVTNAELGEPIQFVVSSARILDGWAFIDATPEKEEGVRIYYEVTRYAEAVEFGLFEERVLALLRESELGWVLFEHNLGDGVKVIADWIDRYEVPEALFEPAP